MARMTAGPGLAYSEALPAVPVDDGHRAVTVGDRRTRGVTEDNHEHRYCGVLQALLAAAFLAHGLLFLFPPADMVELMNATIPPAFRLFLGVAEVLAAVGLTLPAITRVQPWLVSCAAAGLMIVMIGATVLHIARGEVSSAIITAILLVMATFVAYMRVEGVTDPAANSPLTRQTRDVVDGLARACYNPALCLPSSLRPLAVDRRSASTSLSEIVCRFRSHNEKQMDGWVDVWAADPRRKQYGLCSSHWNVQWPRRRPGWRGTPRDNGVGDRQSHGSRPRRNHQRTGSVSASQR